MASPRKSVPAPRGRKRARTRRPPPPLPALNEAGERRRMRTILTRLRKAHPDATCSLDFRDPWQLLVAVVLSAQCTDERVNQVTPALFARWPTPEALAAAPQRAVEEAIHSTGFYRAKARHLKGAAQQVVREHGGRVPRTMAELVALPGVARKTANVVLHVAFGAAAEGDIGIAVDTHVTRLANRLGFVATDDPRRIEARLMAVVPRSAWGDVTHLLIWHGRVVCTARTKPRCGACVIADRCPSAHTFG